MVHSRLEPVIRPLRATDIPAIAAWMLTDEHWLTYGMAVPLIERELTAAVAHHDIVPVADVDGHPAGFAWCIERGMFGTEAYLKRIGVDPAFAGRGIGSRLLQAVEVAVHDAGGAWLYLLVGSSNPRAESFYRARGYEFAGSLPDLAVSGIEERLYRKRMLALSY